MRNISLKDLKGMACSKNISLKKTYKKADYIRELELESVCSTKRFSTREDKVRAIDQETGEEMEFISKHSAARYFGCVKGTICNKILKNSAISQGEKNFEIFKI